MTELSRVLVTLVGDIHHDAFARVKYGSFYNSLQKTGIRVDALDASLRGLSRIWNALQVFSPSLPVWRERFWKNIPAFDTRSRHLAHYIHTHSAQWDLVIQMGVIFDAGRYQDQLPVAIYTDYTARLSAMRPEAGRSPFSVEERNRWFDLERRAYDHALHIFARSRIVRESIIHDYAVPQEKVTVIGAGVNFDPLPEAGPGQGGEVVILFLGKEFHRKGGDILLNAFAQVREKFPSSRLRMMTQMPIPDGLRLEGVELISPTWDRSVVEHLYREAGIFVLPSRLETWGDVLLEAMAYGLPCIGVHVDAIEEIILDGETGLLVPPQDSEALAMALTRLLRDPRERARMGQAGRRRIEASFTWDRVLAHMLKILNRSMGEEII